jgi:hypothetical protein
MASIGVKTKCPHHSLGGPVTTDFRTETCRHVSDCVHCKNNANKQKERIRKHRRRDRCLGPSTVFCYGLYSENWSISFHLEIQAYQLQSKASPVDVSAVLASLFIYRRFQVIYRRMRWWLWTMNWRNCMIENGSRLILNIILVYVQNDWEKPGTPVSRVRLVAETWILDLPNTTSRYVGGRLAETLQTE